KCGVSAVIKSFLRRMAQMRRCFLTKCTIWVGDDKNTKQMSCYAKETGRSMVEMLGVLAIIGVLSVGGIAGYSKAMFKYKLNKQTEQIGSILDYIIINQEHLKTANYQLLGTLKKLNIVSEDMIKENDNTYAYDVFNTKIKLENHHVEQPDGGHAIGLQIDTSQKSIDICRNLMLIAQQRADDISWVYIQRSENDDSYTSASTYYGNKITTRSNYLRNLSISQIDNACRVCEDTKDCFVFVLVGYTTVK
ncbi:MAG: hypothetical protein IJ019_03815, partial [Alphaproteobacteria bacterium]|nr:hypothetical protein [Alphaproteobacteria bacterium]